MFSIALPTFSLLLIHGWREQWGVGFQKTGHSEEAFRSGSSHSLMGCREAMTHPGPFFDYPPSKCQVKLFPETSLFQHSMKTVPLTGLPTWGQNKTTPPFEDQSLLFKFLGPDGICHPWEIGPWTGILRTLPPIPRLWLNPGRECHYSVSQFSSHCDQG